ncbi:MAG: hypothetical protein AAF773_11290 [Cyanobacteria bacterium P01_D01_bin.115]
MVTLFPARCVAVLRCSVTLAIIPPARHSGHTHAPARDHRTGDG